MNFEEWASRISRRTVLKGSAAVGGVLAAGRLGSSAIGTERLDMTTWTPDPTFYPSPEMAMAAPREELAYVATLNPNGNGQPDAITVLDVNPDSTTYGQSLGRLDFPNTGDDLHHFGWNAFSAALCPTLPHPHVERRYLLVPGLRSSRMYIVDAKPDSREPQLIKTIEPDELEAKSGYSRPHTVHCGPDAIYVGALSSPEGDGPGGIFPMDHNTSDIKGRWEADRGTQKLSYDFWWHLGHDIVVTSEWGTPRMVEDSVIPELLLSGSYGHQLHFWDLRKRQHLKALDLGAEQQMVLELRPSHDPNAMCRFMEHVHGQPAAGDAYGFFPVLIQLMSVRQPFEHLRASTAKAFSLVELPLVPRRTDWQGDEARQEIVAIDRSGPR
jgi:56kDa selenium binding protein (SBP56)